jgi:hypothetical protein
MTWLRALQTEQFNSKRAVHWLRLLQRGCRGVNIYGGPICKLMNTIEFLTQPPPPDRGVPYADGC